MRQIETWRNASNGQVAFAGARLFGDCVAVSEGVSRTVELADDAN